MTRGGRRSLWHPFRESDLLAYRVTRRLYKNLLGSRLVFEETNRDLGVTFRYEWTTSDAFGFVRECAVENAGRTPVEVHVLDGLLNLLPANVDEHLQAGFSCLLDAYKRSERVPGTSLALYSLQAQPVDRAEPSESLKATTVWSHGLGTPALHLSASRLSSFDAGRPERAQAEVRGRRGAYLVEARFALAPGAARPWTLVADVDRTQRQVVELRSRLRRPARLLGEVRKDVISGRDNLLRIVAATDGLQLTADRLSSAHHLGNVLFNDLRGGVFLHGYDVQGPDFAAFVRRSNLRTWERHREFLDGLPALVAGPALLAQAADLGDPDLERHALEYLPLTFSRRHGDPSRPWNRFDIQVRDGDGKRVLYFEGNWRDIFQNWEALSLSHPEFTENVIAKFVNASTPDGHNPYRLTKDGIDWEVPDPGHPWSTIGYWGDHQIIYLLKLLELSLDHHPERLRKLLVRDLFSYANVPYEILPFEEIVANPRSTIHFDAEKDGRIRESVPGDGLRREAPAGRRRRRARRARREAARGGARQDGELRAGRGHLAQHPAPGVERRQQRAGGLRRLDGDALLPGAVPVLPAPPARTAARPVGPRLRRGARLDRRDGARPRGPPRHPRLRLESPTPTAGASCGPSGRSRARTARRSTARDSRGGARWRWTTCSASPPPAPSSSPTPSAWAAARTASSTPTTSSSRVRTARSASSTSTRCSRGRWRS